MNQQVQIVWPRPQKVLKTIMVVNVVAYILELILIRAEMGGLVDQLMLEPRQFFGGAIWQPLTYLWLHAASAPGHLLMNLLWLYMFGTELERWWGGRRFLVAYFIFGLAGAALTVLWAAAALALDHPGWWSQPHVGASGAVMGIVVAWGLVQGDRVINLLLVGPIKARTFLLVIIGIEVLVALSLENTSSTSHFGGMIAAFVLCRGLWRPDRLRSLFGRPKPKERPFHVIPGGKDEDRNRWN